MDHSPLCPAFVSPLGLLTGFTPGPCECGVVAPAPITATAVAEPPSPAPAAAPAAAPASPAPDAPASPAAKKPRKPRAKKGAQTQDPPAAAAPPAPPAAVAEVVAPEATVVQSSESACADSRDGDVTVEVVAASVPDGVMVGLGEPQTVTIPPEPEDEIEVQSEPECQDAPTGLCAMCGWHNQDLQGDEFCKSCRDELQEAARVVAEATAASTPAAASVTPVATPNAQDTPPASAKKSRKPRGKKAAAAEAPKTDASSVASSADKGVLAAAKEAYSAAGGYRQVVLEGVNLKSLVPGDTPATVKTALSEAEKKFLLDFVAKNVCTGCREGLLLEGDGMEAVISTGAPGELAFTAITSPEQEGEKWHRSCLEQKVRIEKEGRLKVNPKDGTYEILDKAPAKAEGNPALPPCDDCDKPAVDVRLEDGMISGAVCGDHKIAPIEPAGAIRAVPRQEAIDSTGAPMVATEKQTEQQVVISAASDKKDSGMVVGMKGDTITFTPAAPATPAAPKPRRRLFAGVDPGSQGYIAVVDDTGAVVWTEPMPTTGGDAPIYDEAGMVRVAKRLIELGVEEVLVERQQPIDRIFRGKPFVCPHCKQMKVPRMTAKSNFGKGLGFGLWRGLFAMGGVRYDTIAPITWKRALGIAGGDPKQVKKRAIDKAQTAFSGLDLRDLERSPRARTPNSDKAEALLLARFLMLTRTGGLAAVKEAPPSDEDVADEDEGESDEAPPPATSPVVEGLAASLVAKEAAASVALDKGDGQTHYAGDGCAPPHASATENPAVAGDDGPWLQQMNRTMSERETASPKPAPRAKKTAPSKEPVKPASPAAKKPAKPPATRKPSSEKEKALARVMKSIGKKK